KWLVRLTDCPPSMDAWLTTVFVVPGSRSVPAVQVLLSDDIFPGIGPDLEVTLTAVRMPESARTEIRWSTGTEVAPRGTFVCTAGLGRAGAEDSVPWECRTSFRLLEPSSEPEPPLPQPAATR